MFCPSQAELLTMEAKIGRNSIVVATLLVHSVIVATRQDKTKVMVAGLTELKGSICLAIHSESPETWEAQSVIISGLLAYNTSGSRELSPPHVQFSHVHISNLIHPYTFHPPQPFGSYKFACGSADLLTRFKHQMLSESSCPNVL